MQATCDEHIRSGLLQASFGARAAPLYIQFAVLRVEKAEFSLCILWEFSIYSIQTSDPFVIPCYCEARHTTASQ
jgi:hypothetical protein